MKKMDRRKFIKAGIAGLTGLTVMQTGFAKEYLNLPPETMVDLVPLGKSGLMVSRIAMGTGTKGGSKSSNFTRMGKDKFVNIAHYAYERGVRFYDAADSYGTMPLVGEAVKSYPREKITLLSKMWTRPDNAPNPISVADEIDRFRKELGVDYIDILLIHCMTEGGWSKTRTRYMDGFSKAKQDGIVKSVGMSSHNIDSLREAAVNPWVDVIMARINPFGTNMDGDPDEVKKILATAQSNGKGVIGMKIFGEGKHVEEHEREKSIHYAFTEGNVHCVTLGTETIDQMDDAIGRVMSV